MNKNEVASEFTIDFQMWRSNLKMMPFIEKFLLRLESLNLLKQNEMTSRTQIEPQIQRSNLKIRPFIKNCSTSIQYKKMR